MLLYVAFFACRGIETHLSELFDSDMNDQNEHQLAENMNADSPDTRPETSPDSSLSPKGRGEKTKLSPGVKIAFRIILTFLFLWVYYSAAVTVAMFRVGLKGKDGNGIESTSVIRNLLKDNPSVFFTGKADVAYACSMTPEMRRWNGWYSYLRLFTFTFGWDAKEWNIYLCTEKVEDAEKIKRELASMISDVDGKKCILHVRQYHVYFYHSWPAPSPWDPEVFAKMPSYADYRIDLDHL